MAHLDSKTGLISGFPEVRSQFNFEELNAIQDRLGWVDQKDQQKTIRELIGAVIVLVEEIKSLRLRVCDLEPLEKV